MKDKKLIITTAIIIISILLTIVGYIVLPDNLVMQVTVGGAASNTMPKILGLLVPFGLSSIFAVVYYKTGTVKNLIISVVGLLSYILVYIFNL